MIVHQIFAIIDNEEVMNVIVCDDYYMANELAKGSYGPDAIAVDCLQYPCGIGDKYIDGKFYDISGKEIPYLPTQEQEVANLKFQLNMLATAASFTAPMFTDTQAIEVAEFYPGWSGEGVEYKVGDRVRYSGEDYNLYKVLQDHISQEVWNPEDAPSLFAALAVGDVVKWFQPDNTNPFMKNDKVVHNGKEWISLVDNNIWEPGIEGTEMVWKEIKN